MMIDVHEKSFDLHNFAANYGIFSSFLLLWMLVVFKAQKSSLQLPRGPWRLPITGSLHNLLTAFPRHALWDLARTHGRSMHLNLGEISAVVISAVEAVWGEFLRTHDINFA